MSNATILEVIRWVVLINVVIVAFILLNKNNESMKRSEEAHLEAAEGFTMIVELFADLQEKGYLTLPDPDSP